MPTTLTAQRRRRATERLHHLCERWAAENGVELTTPAGLDRALDAVLTSLDIHHRRRAYRLKLGIYAISQSMAIEHQRRRDGARRARQSGAKRESVDRQAVILRDNSRCYICGKIVSATDLHLDHVIPLSRGGAHSNENLRVACSRCNLRKGILTPAEYLAKLQGVSPSEGRVSSV